MEPNNSAYPLSDSEKDKHAKIEVPLDSVEANPATKKSKKDKNREGEEEKDGEKKSSCSDVKIDIGEPEKQTPGHSYGRKKWYHDKPTLKIVTQIAITIFFCLVEIGIGIYTESIAILADAFHMISDSIALVIGFIALRASEKEATKMMSYGWSRAEVVGGLTNGVFLFSATLFIVIEAIQRFIEVPKIENPMLMVVIGVLGLLINVVGLVLFHGDAHIGHDHGGHSHNHNDHNNEEKTQKKKNKKKEVNLNFHGVFLHVLGDALGSVIVIIVGLCIKFVSGNWKYYLDPTLSLISCVVILNTSIPLIKRCVNILMQGTPEFADTDEIMEEIKLVKGAKNVHDLHVWQLTMKTSIGTVHVVCDKSADFMEVAKEIKTILHNHNIHATTIQPEFVRKKERKKLGDNCAIPCEKCEEETVGLLSDQ